MNEEENKIENIEQNSVIEPVPESQSKIEFKEYLEYYHGDYLQSLFKFCYVHNIFFSEVVYNTLVRKNNDGDLIKLPESYENYIKADEYYSKISFFDQLRLENFEQIYSESFGSIKLSEESKKDRQQIMNIMGYDPFEENLDEDKPQLYRDLTGMLTDAMRKDIPRAKAAVEVVTGYNNIRKYQLRVNSMINDNTLDDDTQKQLDKTLEMITKIQNSINAINDKNGFSNNKSVGTNGRGVLSDVMKTIDEKIYDPGYVNAYDIETSNSIQQIADISNKSILSQIKLTGQDMTDMLAQQSEIVHKAQKAVRQSQEELRLCKAMLKRQELIEKLAQEYREKGISEEDINEFVNREYKMWEK